MLLEVVCVFATHTVTPAVDGGPIPAGGWKLFSCVARTGNAGKSSSAFMRWARLITTESEDPDSCPKVICRNGQRSQPLGCRGGLHAAAADRGAGGAQAYPTEARPTWRATVRAASPTHSGTSGDLCTHSEASTERPRERGGQGKSPPRCSIASTMSCNGRV